MNFLPWEQTLALALLKDTGWSSHLFRTQQCGEGTWECSKQQGAPSWGPRRAQRIFPNSYSLLNTWTSQPLSGPRIWSIKWMLGVHPEYTCLRSGQRMTSSNGVRDQPVQSVGSGTLRVLWKYPVLDEYSRMLSGFPISWCGSGTSLLFLKLRVYWNDQRIWLIFMNLLIMLCVGPTSTFTTSRAIFLLFKIIIYVFIVYRAIFLKGKSDHNITLHKTFRWLFTAFRIKLKILNMA